MVKGLTGLALTIVAFSLLAEPRQESLAVVKSIPEVSHYRRV